MRPDVRRGSRGVGAIALAMPARRLYALPGHGEQIATASTSGMAPPAPILEGSLIEGTPDRASVAAERLGTLSRLFNYMHRAGALGPDDTLDRLEVQNALHKYAYIAQRLGAPLDYKFEFMENGAFSSMLATDIYYRGCAAGGSEPFADDPAASAVFVRLVKGRGAEWLQVTTFALDGRHAGEAREDFVARVRRTNPEYGKKLAGKVYDHVRACLEPGERRP